MTARNLALEALKACTIYACAGGGGAMKNRHLAAIAALEAETGEPVAVYLVATGDIFSGEETYTRHDVRPPLCDVERLYTTPPQTVPPGWKLVPVEPTQQMIRAYDPSGSMAGASWGKRQWLAMIAAAPKAPK